MRPSIPFAVTLLLAGCRLNSTGTATDDPLGQPEETGIHDAGSDATAAPIDSANDSSIEVADTAPEVDAVVEDTASDALDAAPPCTESGAIMDRGHCYFLLTTARSFAGSRTACEMTSPPSHLVSITSAAEHDIAKSLGPGTNRWVGLLKPTASPSVRASFDWTTGESSAGYDGWAPSDPDGGFDCARLRTDGLWADFDCATEFAAICERE